MIAGYRCIPVGGAASFGEKDFGGSLSIVLGVECIVERAKYSSVIGDVDLEAADIDVGKPADHYGQNAGDGIAFGLVIGAATGGVDGPRPRSTAGATGPAAFDCADGGEDAGWDVPIPLGLGRGEIA